MKSLRKYSLVALMLAIVVLAGLAIAKPWVEARGVSIKGPRHITMVKGQRLNLDETVYPKNASYKVVDYMSNRRDIVQTTNSGRLHAKKYGRAVITVVSQSNPKAKDRVYVRVVRKVKAKRISLSPKTMTVQAGQAKRFKVSFTPKNVTSKKVRFTSSNKAIARVSQKGLVRGVKPGSVVITARALDGSRKVSRRRVYVTPRPVLNTTVTGVSLVKDSLTMDVSDTAQLQALVEPLNATNRAVAWDSGETTLVSVSPTGLVASKQTTGTATVTVTTKDGGFKARAAITVVDKNLDKADASIAAAERIAAGLSSDETTESMEAAQAALAQAKTDFNAAKRPGLSEAEIAARQNKIDAIQAKVDYAQDMFNRSYVVGKVLLDGKESGGGITGTLKYSQGGSDYGLTLVESDGSFLMSALKPGTWKLSLVGKGINASGNYYSFDETTVVVGEHGRPQDIGTLNATFRQRDVSIKASIDGRPINNVDFRVNNFSGTTPLTGKTPYDSSATTDTWGPGNYDIAFSYTDAGKEYVATQTITVKSDPESGKLFVRGELKRVTCDFMLGAYINNEDYGATPTAGSTRVAASYSIKNKTGAEVASGITSATRDVIIENFQPGDYNMTFSYNSPEHGKYHKTTGLRLTASNTLQVARTGLIRSNVGFSYNIGGPEESYSGRISRNDVWSEVTTLTQGLHTVQTNTSMFMKVGIEIDSGTYGEGPVYYYKSINTLSKTFTALGTITPQRQDGYLSIKSTGLQQTTDMSTTLVVKDSEGEVVLSNPYTLGDEKLVKYLKPGIYEVILKTSNSRHQEWIGKKVSL